MPQNSDAHEQAVSATRIVLRPLGSVLPLGFFAFGAGALITAFWDLHWISQTEYEPAALALIAFVAPLELLACIFAFLSRDAAGGTAMGLFATTWAVFATFWLSVGPLQSPALGVFSVMLTGSVLCLSIVSLPGNPLSRCSL